MDIHVDYIVFFTVGCHTDRWILSVLQLSCRAFAVYHRCKKVEIKIKNVKKM